MFEERTGRDTANLAMLLFRLGIVITFVVMVARMFQLQVVQNAQYESLADQNRLLRIETPATRGIVYDRNDTILVRNRPSFEVALVPDDLPFDDLETTHHRRRGAGDREGAAHPARRLPTPKSRCAWPRFSSTSWATRITFARCRRPAPN